MTDSLERLAELGWSNHFAAQIAEHDLATLLPARVLAVHRNGLEVAAPGFEGRVPPIHTEADEDQATVGDFVLLDATSHLPRRRLARKSLFKRKAAGTGRRIQLIAANVDTLLVVSSCNRDFNVARLERYLALAREAEVMPMVVLTKADLVDDPHGYVTAASRLLPSLFVECLDARDFDATSRLAPWCGLGQTVALVGSSGVGKSTLVNTLAGEGRQSVAGIREDDAHGRHTTTGRSMHRLDAGGWLIDTPACAGSCSSPTSKSGIADVFADVAEVPPAAASPTAGMRANPVARSARRSMPACWTRTGSAASASLSPRMPATPPRSATGGRGSAALAAWSSRS